MSKKHENKKAIFPVRNYLLANWSEISGWMYVLWLVVVGNQPRLQLQFESIFGTIMKLLAELEEAAYCTAHAWEVEIRKNQRKEETEKK